jgi:hypothetical protein
MMIMICYDFSVGEKEKPPDEGGLFFMAVSASKAY